MADRYYCDQTIQGDHATLEGQEAQHLGKVMRAGPGDRIILFDNSGDQFEAEIEQVQRQKISLKILSRDSICRELPELLTLFTALPKGDRQRFLVEKTVEIGVSRLVPLITARSVVKPKHKTIERLQRTVIEASKQCGRNRLMEISPPQTWAEVLSETKNNETARLIAHPLEKKVSEKKVSGTFCRNGPKGASHKRYLTPFSPGPITIAVGPEGGFTDEEVEQATKANWQVIDLGPRILRIETAALLLVARVTQ